jgi:aryl-alcohol dehydrogenase-like predicted oxidoreductase
VDYEIGLLAVEELKEIFPGRENLASLALRWVLMFDSVSCVIPGASRGSQLSSNLVALDEEAISLEQMEGVKEIYDRRIKAQVHHLW